MLLYKNITVVKCKYVMLQTYCMGILLLLLKFTVTVQLIHSYLAAYVKRRQQTVEFNAKYKKYLKDEIEFCHGYSAITLVLVG